MHHGESAIKLRGEPRQMMHLWLPGERRRFHAANVAASGRKPQTISLVAAGRQTAGNFMRASECGALPRRRYAGGVGICFGRVTHQLPRPKGGAAPGHHHLCRCCGSVYPECRNSTADQRRCRDRSTNRSVHSSGAALTLLLPFFWRISRCRRVLVIPRLAHLCKQWIFAA